MGTCRFIREQDLGSSTNALAKPALFSLPEERGRILGAMARPTLVRTRRYHIINLIFGFPCQPAERQSQVLVECEGIKQGSILKR